MSWTTPGLLFLLLCGNFIQESFVYFLCLFNLALFFFVPFSFFLLTMLRSEMPGLRKPSGERGVAPVADEFVDGAPLHMAGLPGRLPEGCSRFDQANPNLLPNNKAAKNKK
jgi:hypothetical protein